MTVRSRSTTDRDITNMTGGNAGNESRKPPNSCRTAPDRPGPGTCGPNSTANRPKVPGSASKDRNGTFGLISWQPSYPRSAADPRDLAAERPAAQLEMARRGRCRGTPGRAYRGGVTLNLNQAQVTEGQCVNPGLPDLGPSLVVPFGSGGNVRGVIVVSRAPGSPPFPTSLESVVEVFAEHANARQIHITVSRTRPRAANHRRRQRPRHRPPPKRAGPSDGARRPARRPADHHRHRPGNDAQLGHQPGGRADEPSGQRAVIRSTTPPLPNGTPRTLPMT